MRTATLLSSVRNLLRPVGVLAAGLVATLYIGEAKGQSITIGTGTTTTNGTVADPVERYFNYTHYQMVWTAAELTAAGLPSGANLTGLGFSISEAGGTRANYTIKIAHTLNANATTYISTGFTTVRTAFTYTPVVQTAGNFDMIAFSTPFAWNGTSNIVVDICTGSNPFASPYGGLRYTTATNMTRYIRTDGSSNCATATSINSGNRPNIRFNYTGGSACSGTPAPGNTLTTASSACTGSNFTLSVQNATSGTGVTYQWQSANNAAFTLGVTNLGTASTQVTSLAGASKYYRCQVTCSGNTGTSTPVLVSLISDQCQCGTYAVNFASSTLDEEITSVTVGTMTNASTCATTAPGPGSILNRYSNYTGSVTGPSVQAGSSVSFSLTQTSCGGSFGNGFQIYVDYNQNGNFGDAGEQVYTQPVAATGNHTKTGSFTVPVSATLGTTRMRIVNVEATFPTITNYAQLAYTYGETEDYCFTVTAPPACSGTPAPGNTISSVSSACSGVNFNLSLQNSTTGTGVTYQWQSADDAAFTVNVTNLGTAITQTTSQTSAKYYRCQVTCSTGPATGTSTAVFVGLGGNCECATYPTNFASSAIDSEISNVTVGSMNNTSNCATTAPGPGSIQNRYSNYTGSVTGPSVEAGLSVSFSLTMTTCGGSYANGFQIFCDWNQDGDFADVDETMYSAPAATTGNHTETGSFTVPVTALVGTTRMRVVCAEATFPTVTNYAQLAYTYGETEDYCFTVTAPAPCAGTPAPGNTISSVSTACSGVNFNLSLQNQTAGVGVTYQWQSADDAAFTVNVTNLGTTNTQTTSQTAAKYYRCQVTCSAGPATGTSTPVFVDLGGSCQCTAYPAVYAGFTGDEEITNVTVGTMNNSSTCATTAPGAGSINQRYSNYAGLVTGPSVEAGLSVSFSLTQTTCGFNYDNGFQIYVDYNQDGDFADAGEQAYSQPVAANGNHTKTGSFTVPVTATIGTTRMRIVNVETLFPTATNYAQIAYGWGETEDYCFTVTAPAPCAGTPAPGNTISSASTVCSGVNFDLSLQNATAGVGVTYQWQSADDAAFTVNVASLGTSITQTTNQTAAKYYRCQVTCSTGPATGTSTPVFVDLGGACQCTAYPAVYAGSTGDEEITNVTVGTMNNSSTCLTTAPGAGSINQRYSNYTGSVTGPSVEAGLPVSFSLTQTTCVGNFGDGFQIYVDYNQDGDFADAGEQAYSQPSTITGNHTVTGSFTVPVTATVGTTRMRVVNVEGTFPTATNYAQTAYTWGETEDYCFTVTAPAPCAGTPVPGNTISSASTVCSGVNFNLSLQNATAGVGVTYQWESADDAAFTVNVANLGTSFTQTTNQTSAKYYRCQVTCSSGPATGISTPVFVDMGGACQCTAYPVVFAGNTADEDISNVTVGTMNNSSTCASLAPGAGSVANRYSNYTGSVTGPSVEAGLSVTFSLTQTTCGGNFGNGFQIYVDYNQDGDFADAGEQAYNQPVAASGNHTKTGSFTVPITATPGVTRMRVVNVESTFPTATNYAQTAYTWGETEDYCFTITAPAPCAGTPAPGITISSIPTACSGVNFDLSLQNQTVGVGVTYDWQSADDAAFTVNVATGLGSSSTLTTSQTAAKYYRCVVTCTNGPATGTSTPVLVGLGSACQCNTFCIPTQTGSAAITNVTINTLNNTTASASPYYSYQSGTTNLLRTSSYALTVTCDASAIVSVWFDWDGSNTFTAGEWTQVYTAGTTGTVSIAVPLTAVNDVRMRIRSRLVGNPNGAGDACSAFGSGEAEDYCLTVSDPSCWAPGVPTASGITSSGATLNWAAASPAPGVGYQWEIRTAGLPGSGGATASGSVGSGTLTATASGLSSFTTYYGYVRSDCGAGDFSTWSGPVQFITPCTNFTLTYTQNWDVLPITCWTVQQVSGGGNATVSTGAQINPATTAFNGSNFVWFNSYNFASGTESRLISPPITTTGTVGVDVEFRWFHDNTAYTGAGFADEGAYLEYSTDGTTWTVVGPQITRLGGTNGWNLKTITLPAGAGNQPTIWVAMRFRSRFGNNCSMDNFVVKPTPPCQAMTAINPTTITGANSGTVNFNCVSCTGPITVEYGLTGFTPGTGATAGVGGTISSSTLPSNTTSHSISFPVVANYDVYVREDCYVVGYGANSNVAKWYAGDVCLNAIPVSSIPYTHNGYTAGYTDDYSASPCGASYMDGNDIVYTFTPATNQTLALQVSGITNTHAAVHVFTQCPSTATSCFGFDSNDYDTNPLIIDPFTVTAGTTYYIVISSSLPSQAINGYTLNIIPQPQPPVNDVICEAKWLACGPNGESCDLANWVQGTNYAATMLVAPGDPTCQSDVSRDVWYKATVGPTGHIAVYVRPGAGVFQTNAIIDMFSSSDNTCNGTLTSIACNDDGGTGNYPFIYQSGLTPGQVVFVRVMGRGLPAVNNGGTFEITATRGYQWTGTTNTDWTNTGNWLHNDAPVPSAGTNVYIPDVTNDITLFPGSHTANGLWFYGNATMTIDAGGGPATLDVKANVTGVLTPGGTSITGSGTLRMSGTTAQVLRANTNISNLTIDNAAGVSLAAGANVRITPSSATNPGALTLTSGVFNATPGVVTLVSNATGTAYLNDFTGTGTYTGNITQERYATGTGFHYVGSAINNADIQQINEFGTVYGPNGAQIIASVNCSSDSTGNGSPYGRVFEFNQSNTFSTNCFQWGWNVRSSGTLTNGRGYAATTQYPSLTFGVTGTPNTGDIVVGTLSNSGGFGDGRHLLANPYPSPVNLPAMAGFDAAASLWQTSGAFTGTYQTRFPGQPIGAGQGFFKRTGSSGSWTWTNAMRTTGNPAFFMETPWYDGMVSIRVDGNGFADLTSIVFKSGATAGFDSDYDAHKLMSNSDQPTLYTTLAGERMSFNSNPNLEGGSLSVPMGMEPGTTGTFTIKVEQIQGLEPGTVVVLEDRATAKLHDLRTSGAYTFSMAEGDDADRFVVHFNPDFSSTPVAADAFGVQMYTDEEQLIINNLGADMVADIDIFSATGQLIHSFGRRTVMSGNNPYTINGLAAGVYVVRLSSDRGTQSSRIAVR